MSGFPPEAVAAVLRTAGTAHPDPRLDEVLATVRRQWETIARLRFPELGPDREDALQLATLRLITPEKLALLEDGTLVWAWARSIFVNTAIDVLRDRRRERRHRQWLSTADDDAETVLRERLPARQPTPEETARDRERLGLALELVQALELARLRFVDGVSEKALAQRFGLTRDAVASQLKRLRRRIRRALGDVE